MSAVIDRARRCGLLPQESWAALDSTALSTRHASEYFRFRRARDGREITIRNWPKLGLAVEVRSHLVLGATAGKGLSYDFALFEPLLRQAVTHARVGLAMSDAGFDSEHNHVIAREVLGVPRTLINLNRRGKGPNIHGRYRREMSRRFSRRLYGQRWQVEAVISQIKRRLGSVLHARNERSQSTEMLIKVLTHTIAVVR